MEVFRKRLKEAREARNKKQRELGEAIHVTKSSISYYESGQRTPSIDIIEKIAEYLEVDFLWLLGKEIKVLPDRSGSKIVQLSQQDLKIIRSIHLHPELFEYLLENTEARIAKIARNINR